MASGGTVTLAGWRVRRSLVVLVVGALLASLLAVAPVDVAGAASDSFGSGRRLSVEITDPVDGAAIGTDELVLRGSVEVGAGESGPDQSLVLVLDVTGSMRSSSGADCTGDGVIDSRWVCQYGAAWHFLEAAAEAGTVSEIGMVVFGSSAVAADVSPEPGIQLFTAPDADLNDSGELDLCSPTTRPAIACSRPSMVRRRPITTTRRGC